MSYDLEKLYKLLPAFYRIRDIELGNQLFTPQEKEQIALLKDKLKNLSAPNGEEANLIKNLLDEKQRGPLKALLSLIADQVTVLEEDIKQLYDDQFIETCAEWVVPYIGDLVGTSDLHVFPDATFSQRAQVANTLAYRRRKGTAAVLEQLARDVTSWNVSVVEFFQLLATTQYMKHIRSNNLSMADLRTWEPLERLNTPFDRITRTVDVRRIKTKRGKYNIPNIGIYLWRINSFPLTKSPAFKVDDRRYCFDALGKDLPLYNRPETEDEITQLAESTNVPMPISRRILDQYLETYYGTDKSILLNLNNKNVLPPEINPINMSPPAEKLADIISVCNLSDLKDAGGNVTGWAHMPQDKIAIDPELGRIAFPSNQPPPDNVHVTYHYGFSAEMGGGQYERVTSFSSGLQSTIKVPSEKNTLQDALDELSESGGVVEVENGEYYLETPEIKVAAGKKLELRAKNKIRPILVLGDELKIIGGANAEVVLNGLLICGGFLSIPTKDNQNRKNKLRLLKLLHTTLLPGPSPAIQTVNAQPNMPRLFVELQDSIVEIDRCIVGGIRAVDGAQVSITNSIVDATEETGVAYAGLFSEKPGAPFKINNSTIIGKVYTLMMEMVSNTIFLASCTEPDTWVAPVKAERLQKGCVRFSYLPPGSVVPRPYRCQPTSKKEAARVRPVFTSLRYGDAGYCQLSLRCAPEIRQGADDEAEMGAFHNLYQPQREANLRVRIDEYMRFSMEAGVFYAS